MILPNQSEIEILKKFLGKNLDILIEKLQIYVNELLKYNEKYNLIGKSTIEKIWIRHIIDSMQIFPLIDEKNAVDIGSGAGLPGIPLAIAGLKVFLIEKSPVKSQFLKNISDELQLNTIIINENFPGNFQLPKNAIFASRAFKSLAEMLEIFPKNSKIITLKGKNFQNEINIAKQKFDFKYEIFDSILEEGKILKINL